MNESKYNYSKTAEVLKEVADTTQTISRIELMKLMAGDVIEDKKELMRFSSAINNLKNRTLSKLNIELTPVQDPVNKNKVTHYKVCYVTENKPEWRESKSVKKTREERPSDLALSALQKNNQKLFLDLESMKEKYAELEQQYAALQAREANYKSIIESYHALAMA